MGNIATETKVVHDEALGIDRRVFAGQEIPPDLLDAYDGGTTDRAPDAPDANIATADKVVHDEALGIDRRVLAGQEVPADLVDAYEDAGGTTTDVAPDVAPDAADGGYGSQTVDELQALADERDLDVEGTGADGRVLKADLVAALQASD